MIEPICCGWIHCSCGHGWNSRCYDLRRHVLQASRMSVLGRQSDQERSTRARREGQWDIDEAATEASVVVVSTAPSSARDVEGVRSERRALTAIARTAHQARSAYVLTETGRFSASQYLLLPAFRYATHQSMNAMILLHRLALVSCPGMQARQDVPHHRNIFWRTRQACSQFLCAHGRISGEWPSSLSVEAVLYSQATTG